MHISVLLDEVIKYLDPKQNENFIDATFGEGGHSAAILEKTGPKGKVLALEADSELYEKFFAAGLRIKNNEELKSRLILINRSYTELKEVVKENNFWPVNGILFDLGMASWHLESSGRGFSFLRDEPLDMRFGAEKQELTARDIVNKWPEAKIEEILRKYGEERWSGRIVRNIVEARKIKAIETTLELAEIVKKSVPKGCRYSRINPATRTFQALRIAVNDELENLKIGLRQALEILAPAGRIVVISFHSGEDRIVKNFFREEVKKGTLKILTKKPVVPSPEEIRRNPRARSAKLRAAKINSRGINFNTELRI